MAVGVRAVTESPSSQSIVVVVACTLHRIIVIVQLWFLPVIVFAGIVLGRQRQLHSNPSTTRLANVDKNQWRFGARTAPVFD